MDSLNCTTCFKYKNLIEFSKDSPICRQCKSYQAKQQQKKKIKKPTSGYQYVHQNLPIEDNRNPKKGSVYQDFGKFYPVI